MSLFAKYQVLVHRILLILVYGFIPAIVRVGYQLLLVSLPFFVDISAIIRIGNKVVLARVSLVANFSAIVGVRYKAILLGIPQYTPL